MKVGGGGRGGCGTVSGSGRKIGGGGRAGEVQGEPGRRPLLQRLVDVGVEGVGDLGVAAQEELLHAAVGLKGCGGLTGSGHACAGCCSRNRESTIVVLLSRICNLRQAILRPVRPKLRLRDTLVTFWVRERIRHSELLMYEHVHCNTLSGGSSTETKIECQALSLSCQLARHKSRSFANTGPVYIYGCWYMVCSCGSDDFSLHLQSQRQCSGVHPM